MAIPSFTTLIHAGLLDDLLLLDIAGNQIGADEFIQICSQIMEHHTPLKLQELWLGGCPITDDGVQILTTLIHNDFLPDLTILCVDSRNESENENENENAINDSV